MAETFGESTEISGVRGPGRTRIRAPSGEGEAGIIAAVGGALTSIIKAQSGTDLSGIIRKTESTMTTLSDRLNAGKITRVEFRKQTRRASSSFEAEASKVSGGRDAVQDVIGRFSVEERFDPNTDTIQVIDKFTGEVLRTKATTEETAGSVREEEVTQRFGAFQAEFPDAAGVFEGVFGSQFDPEQGGSAQPGPIMDILDSAEQLVMIKDQMDGLAMTLGLSSGTANSDTQSQIFSRVKNRTLTLVQDAVNAVNIGQFVNLVSADNGIQSADAMLMYDSIAQEVQGDISALGLDVAGVAPKDVNAIFASGRDTLQAALKAATERDINAATLRTREFNAIIAANVAAVRAEDPELVLVLANKEGVESAAKLASTLNLLTQVGQAPGVSGAVKAAIRRKQSDVLDAMNTISEQNAYERSVFRLPTRTVEDLTNIMRAVKDDPKRFPHPTFYKDLWEDVVAPGLIQLKAEGNIGEAKFKDLERQFRALERRDARAIENTGYKVEEIEAARESVLTNMLGAETRSVVFQ